MTFAERMIDRLEGSRFGRRLDALGAFSPLATLKTFSPGAQALLISVERDAERGLHVARGLFVLVVALAFVASAGLAHVTAVAPIGVAVLGAIASVALWVVVWRAISRPRPPRWLKYALIVFDAFFAARTALFVQSPLYTALNLDQVLPRGLLISIVPPLLVFVVMTGAFRLHPNTAVFAMLASMAAYVVTAAALGVTTGEAIVFVVILWFAGVVSVQASRIFRYMALKAREQAVLERYVPEALTRELARTGDPGAGREVDITVAIVDIRGYTRRAERLTPKETVAFLNDYFGVVVAPLAAEGAVLDKYIGDGVFAFFEGAEHERRALRAARAILASLERYNAAHPEGEPISVGVALHTGKALVGSIGAEQKREYTAIADTVNLAARLEELNKSFHSHVVASEAVVEAVGAEACHDFRGPELTPIRGHEAPIAVRYLPREAVPAAV